MIKTWNKAQAWEKDWHGNCVNSLNEEQKQLVYANRMGLDMVETPTTPYNIDLKEQSVLDIGGGAYSLLLKAINFDKHQENSKMGAAVIDPLEHPQWVLDRYKAAGIFFKRMAGEDINIKSEGVFNEVWIYNVLQHTQSPKKIIENAKKVGKLIRIFEWIDTDVNIGHLHTLSEDSLNEWLGGEGKVENLKESGCFGRAFYGVFPA